MRKHGWRTPEWKLIVALEPDFHFKPEVELYNLVEDPAENVNLADREPEIARMLRGRMGAWISKREAETGLTNPMFTNLQWHGTRHEGPFPSSKAAYDSPLHRVAEDGKGTTGPGCRRKRRNSRRRVVTGSGPASSRIHNEGD